MLEITLRLPRDEANALVVLVKKITFEDCARWSRGVRYARRRQEVYVMWSALKILSRALKEADAEFKPRKIPE